MMARRAPPSTPGLRVRQGRLAAVNVAQVMFITE